MGDKWKEMRFGDCADLVRDTCQPNESFGKSYIGLEHIEQGTLRLNSIGIAEDVTSTKSNFKSGDILFGKLRPYFRKVVRTKLDGICSTDIWVVRAKDGVDQGFLFYWMASKEFVDIANQGSEGTKMPRAKWDFVTKIQQTVPPLPEQKAIASILGMLDDKIELNRKMNETLEAMARAIFKSWFVDFEPIPLSACDAQAGGIGPHKEWQDLPLGRIPKGWRVGKVKECCSRVENGGTPRRDEPTYWNPATVSWLTSGEVRQDIVILTENKISENGLVNSSAKLWPKWTTVVALYGATAGQVCLLANEMCANQACCGLVAIPNMELFNYLYISSSVQQFEQLARGSAQQNLSQQIVADLEIIIPDPATLQKFQEAVKPLFDREILNLEQSLTLASIRDALLPKLLSGEIRVKDAERFVEEALES